jgi:RNA polymerase-interacting CarD/CdnL/TRCF family regulator
MKSLNTLLRENGFTEPKEYYDLILDKFNKGNHIKCSELFQDLKREEREYFLCIYIHKKYVSCIPIMKFFIKELIQN